jgi:hypothetical protein
MLAGLIQQFSVLRFCFSETRERKQGKKKRGKMAF